ncbi:MAG: response regulator transcription factor [Oscillospiraceae bacterium]|jgi:two-component system alkaline phosphatase synthesis response regulator PhoP|nr:response regulator transcription factor [Oscillospiraceae bacterium]
MRRLVYIVEDDESIRELVRMALVSFSYEVKAFDNAGDGLAAIAEQPPGLALFDIMLPGMSGLEAMKLLRQSPKTKRLPVILLTAKTAELDKIKGLDCGADDYITKPFSVMELGARIRALFRRIEDEASCEAEPRVVSFSDFTVNHGAREVVKEGALLHLTFKEYELLWVLIREKDRIVTREELLSAVWGNDFLGESRTLDMHIRTLRGKLGDDAEHPKYIKTIRNVGYRFVGV